MTVEAPTNSEKKRVRELARETVAKIFSSPPIRPERPARPTRQSPLEEENSQLARKLGKELAEEILGSKAK